jgi:hypothetical protein
VVIGKQSFASPDFRNGGEKMQKNPSNMSQMNDKHYRNLLIMTLLSFIAMYILMYAMVNVVGNVFNNLNNAYMAGLMAAPMLPFAILVMRDMYMDKKRNALIIAGSLIMGVLFFMLIRAQGAISDDQFLRSMIPHHASAIQMCEQANIQDAEIKDLCKNIISSQQQEIDQMKSKLAELEK